MSVLEGNPAVLVPSDEMDIINHLRESERLRQRRAKIEEIRAKMRAARESEGIEEIEEGEEATEEKGENETKGDHEAEQKEENQKNGLFSTIGDVASAVGNGCKNASGVFRQINKKGKPIFEHISGGKMGMRQINMKGKKAIFKPSKGVTNSVANGVGKVALVAAVAMDVCEIGMAIKQDYEGGTKHNTVHSASGVAGSWAGAVPGAMYGASLGSFVPGAGSLVGGILGGVIGSLGGGFLARKAAETVMPAPDDNKKDDDDDAEVVETPGQCVLCRQTLADFDLFYHHFVENHPEEFMTLFNGVLGRAGEERADIEDRWFVSKAFVIKEEEIESWGMEDILSFNDGILVKMGWNEEKEKADSGYEGSEEEEEEIEKEMEMENMLPIKLQPIKQSGPVIEEHRQLGGMLSVL